MKVLVLLSGGLDSTVVLASFVRKHECAAIGFDYGQPHLIELERAKFIAGMYHAPFQVVKLPSIPLVNDVVFAGRNLVLASHAIAHAAAEGFNAIAVGCNESDWIRFPDCRPNFWNAVHVAAEFYDVSVLAPLLHMWKGDILRLAKDMNVPIDITWSCYSPRDRQPCGECLACKTRQEALCLQS